MGQVFYPLTASLLYVILRDPILISPHFNHGGKLKPGEGLGMANAKDKQEEFLSQIISRLNELFVTDHLTEKDLVNYAYTIRDKISVNTLVMKQIANNSTEQAMLGDFIKAVDDAVMDSSESHQNQMMQLLSNPAKAAGFAKVVFDLLKLTK